MIPGVTWPLTGGTNLFATHVGREDKQRTLGEVLRVLKPDGKLLLGDFGKPANIPMYLISLVMRRLEHTKDNIEGLLPAMMA